MFWAVFRFAPTEIHWNDLYLTWIEKGGPRLVVPHAIALFILPIALILAFWFGPATAVKFGPLGRHWLGFMDGATEA
jgi:hypothetical protein